nr:vinorine synthase-like [Ipomoea batatas]
MLGVQVNRFRCGGTAVGFCTWHGAVDGIGMANLYNTMAAINRGERAMRTVMSGPMKKKLGKYASKRYIFSKQDIERIRNQYSQSEHRRRPSRVVALSAFVWAAVIRATLVANPTLKTHLLTHYVNLRNKLNPPLPSQCLGNILQGTDSVWEVAGGPVTGRSLVGRVVEAMDKVTNDYVREMHLEGGFLKSITARQSKIVDYNKGETKVLSISSLCKIPFNKVDFGWGKPIWIGMPQTLLDLALFVDTEDGGVEVWIGLDHEVMCNLDKDMEFHAYVSFAHIGDRVAARSLTIALHESDMHRDEEDINRDARVGEDCENEDQEIGEYECIHDCAESIKPYMGQRFQTLDEGVRYYKEYAAFVGFDVRASTIKKNRYGDVEVKYLLCSREGYTVTKAQRSSTAGEGNEANINTRLRVSNRVGCMARCALKRQKDELYAVNVFIESHKQR